MSTGCPQDETNCMSNAPYVALGAALLAMICCVFCAFAWWKASGMVTRLRSMSSMQGELVEIRDYLVKLDAWSKRLNSRLVMQDRRQAPTPMSPMTSGDLKQQLRERVGLVAGKPAPHR
jgi:hypothetical protein